MIEMFFELSYMTQQSHDMLPCAGYIHKLSVETNMYILTYIYTYVRSCTNIGKIHKSCLSIVYMYVYVTYFGTDSHGNQFPIVTSYSNHNNVVYDKISTQNCAHSL